MLFEVLNVNWVRLYEMSLQGDNKELALREEKPVQTDE